MQVDKTWLRFKACQLALEFLRKHGRPPFGIVQWERVFNALHPTYSLSVIQAVDSLLSEYITERALQDECNRLGIVLDEPQNVQVIIITPGQ